MAEFTPEELREIETLRAGAPPTEGASTGTSTPLRILQTLASFAPPSGLVGGTVGGLAGAGLGAMAGGIGAVPGSIVGAGLGAAGEENLRQMVSGRFAPLDVARAGVESSAWQAAGEGIFAPARYLLNRRALTLAQKKSLDAYQKANLARGETIVAGEEAAAAKTRADLTTYEKGVGEAAAKTRAAQAAQRAEALRVKQEHATYETKAAAAREGTRQDLAAQKATTERLTQQHETALAGWADRGAETVSSAWRQMVPSWSDLPAGKNGLLEMVYGTGQARVSTMFDAALKEIVAAGRGRLVPLSQEAATALGLEAKGLVGSISGAADLAVVDAGDAAAKVTGFWTKDRKVYREVVDALDRMGLGNAEARAEYKNAMSVIDFVAQNKILEGKVFHPDRVLKGMTTTLRSINALRSRGTGDVFRGPFAEALEGAPSPLVLPGAPSPRPMPTKPTSVVPPAPLPEPRPARPRPTPAPEAPPGVGPPPLLPEGFSTMRLPGAPHPFWVGGALAQAPASLMSRGAAVEGTGRGFHSSMPFALGGATAAYLSGRELVTRAGRSPAIEALFHLFPTLAAQYAGTAYFGHE